MSGVLWWLARCYVHVLRGREIAITRTQASNSCSLTRVCGTTRLTHTHTLQVLGRKGKHEELQVACRNITATCAHLAAMSKAKGGMGDAETAQQQVKKHSILLFLFSFSLAFLICPLDLPFSNASRHCHHRHSFSHNVQLLARCCLHVEICFEVDCYD